MAEIDRQQALAYNLRSCGVACDHTASTEHTLKFPLHTCVWVKPEQELRVTSGNPDTVRAPKRFGKLFGIGYGPVSRMQHSHLLDAKPCKIKSRRFFVINECGGRAGSCCWFQLSIGGWNNDQGDAGSACKLSHSLQ